MDLMEDTSNNNPQAQRTTDIATGTKLTRRQIREKAGGSGGEFRLNHGPGETMHEYVWQFQQTNQIFNNEDFAGSTNNNTVETDLNPNESSTATDSGKFVDMEPTVRAQDARLNKEEESGHRDESDLEPAYHNRRLGEINSLPKIDGRGSQPARETWKNEPNSPKERSPEPVDKSAHFSINGSQADLHLNINLMSRIIRRNLPFRLKPRAQIPNVEYGKGSQVALAIKQSFS